ncbi:MAG: heme exporter protein CcmB [Candidatus Eisenbacteria bacterium]|nr:heme exporter protein CcmB [Candidatus Eisenbacteria bacterium]MCC7143078.1 heme exporter protein CcmB [Candidatus Eisenbacteria bacterium]
MNAYLRGVFGVLRKDLRLEWRSREAMTAMAFFSLLVVVLFGFSFQTEKIDVRTTAPGLLWVAFSFSGVLGLNRSFSLERENGALRALMLAPLDRSAIFVGKMLSNLVMIGLVEALTVPLFSVLLRVPVLSCLPQLTLVTCLGTLGFAAVGTLLAGISSGSRMREVLLPLILYPIWIPILVASVEATGTVLSGKPLSEAGDWLTLIGVFDLVFLGVGFLFFEAVLEE